MQKSLGVLLLASICLFSAGPAAGVTIDWSPVGNAGNPADGSTGFGAVGYAYNIGKYDVTNSQYVEFLNAKDASGLNTLGLYNSNMSTTTPAAAAGGINFTSGNPNGSKYGVISGHGSQPVNYVTWYDAIRFANWLNNGQGSGDTESGAYTLLGGTPTPTNGLSITRNAGARMFLPSENEWYKAAYYNPGTHSYFQYPTSSNTTPSATSPPGGPNSANFQLGGPGQLTDVGAYTATTSPYGAFDMGGNVFQWNEALLFTTFRGARGGSFITDSSRMLSSHQGFQGPTVEDDLFGFRVASTIPEPSTGVLAVFGGSMLWWWRKRFK